MVDPLLAMPPPYWTEIVWPVGFLSVLLIACLFVTATRKLGGQSERDRRAGLALMAIVCGPLMGMSLAWLANNTQGRVHPEDARNHWVAFTGIGFIAGVLGGIAFGISGLFSLGTDAGKGVPAKSLTDTDEL